jgi:uncharacterized protein (TIGR02453 family)
MGARRYFTPQTFRFLTDLKENNSRAWFHENKDRYEKHVKAPAFRFIEDVDPLLTKISPHFMATPRSLFRIHRDTRFSRDKSPYKTHTGIQFRHEASKDAHTPGYYLHLQPGEVFMGCGIWRPDSRSLLKIREAIVEDPAKWKRVRNGKRFKENFELEGDSLKTHPRGFDPEHPLIEDLRRKDFIGVRRLTHKLVTGPDLPAEFTALCKAGTGLQKFLCNAIGVAY